MSEALSAIDKLFFHLYPYNNFVLYFGIFLLQCHSQEALVVDDCFSGKHGQSLNVLQISNFAQKTKTASNILRNLFFNVFSNLCLPFIKPLKSVLGSVVLVFEDDKPFDELDILNEHTAMSGKSSENETTNKSVSKRSKFKKLCSLT